MPLRDPSEFQALVAAVGGPAAAVGGRRPPPGPPQSGVTASRHSRRLRTPAAVPRGASPV